MNAHALKLSAGMITFVGLIWLVAGPNSSAAPQPGAVKPPERKTDASIEEFMRAKLGASERILEGLVTEDFEMIKEGADRLKKISSGEKWRISNDPLYRHHSAQFQQVAERLHKAASEEKLDSAALEWMQATMSCVECHKFVRGAALAEK